MKYVSLAFVGVFALTNCTATNSSRPSSIDPNRDFNALVINSTLDSVSPSEIVNPAGVTRTRRNSIIQARLAEIDVLYNSFESQVSYEIRNGNFGFSLAELLVGTAGTLASANASQNLSAVSTVLAGSRAAYNKDILLDQTLQVFVSQMRANRNAVKKRIIEKLPKAPTEYTLQMALSDLTAYEQAGSLASALASISETSSQEQKTTERALEVAEDNLVIERTVRTQSFDIHGRDLASYLDSGTFPTEQAERYRLLNDCYQRTVPNSNIVSLGEYIPTADEDGQEAGEIKSCMSSRYQINIGNL